MPRPSSPLDAKASIRSPYALDRSQQNSCVGTVLAKPGYETRPGAHTCALSLPDNDVFTRIPLKRLSAGKPFSSQCHRSAPPADWPKRRKLVIRDRARELGGARRDRTDDLMLAKHALYQLSYGPSSPRSRFRSAGASLSIRRLSAQGSPFAVASEDASCEAPKARRRMVGPGRLELPTSRLSGVCSNHLSYRPLKRSARRMRSRKGRRAPDARSHRSLVNERLQCFRKEKRRRRRSAPDWCLWRINSGA